MLTGVSLALPDGAQQSVTVTTTVFMRPLKPAEIDAYWASGEPVDKAGGYAVQGLGGAVLEDARGPEKVWIADPDGQRIELLTPRAGYHRRPRP